jgi:hypothetical protein
LPPATSVGRQSSGRPSDRLWKTRPSSGGRATIVDVTSTSPAPRRALLARFTSRQSFRQGGHAVPWLRTRPAKAGACLLAPARRPPPPAAHNK